MTIEERLDKLTGRHEAPNQTVELMAAKNLADRKGKPAARPALAGRCT
jgi:hypothetical protein